MQSERQVAKQRDHEPQLDGVRGLAILAVLIAHAVNFLQVAPLDASGAWWSRWLVKYGLQGWGGVDLFFVLSGFLITGILLRARDSQRYYVPFYMRRALRILPIYYLFLIVTLVLAYATHFPALDMPHSARWWLPFFVHMQNLPVFWTSWVGMVGLWGIFWSLAVEEQFYAVWPVVVRSVQVRTMLIVCLIGFALGPLERFLLIRVVGLHIGVMQWPFSRLDGLFLGAAVALYAEWRGRTVPLSWAVAAGSIGAALFSWIAVWHPDELLGAGPRIWSFGVTAFVLISAALVVATQYGIPLLRAVLTQPWLRLMGRWSYGMYVYHLLVYRLLLSFLRRVVYPRAGMAPRLWFSAAVILVGIGAVTAVAALSYRFIETPFLRLKRFFPTESARG